jgi:hypothetical protein
VGCPFDYGGGGFRIAQFASHHVGNQNSGKKPRKHPRFTDQNEIVQR